MKLNNLVKVYPNNYKPIKYIGYSKLKNNSHDYRTMYIMKKSQLNNLVEDLIVTGLHYVEDRVATSINKTLYFLTI